MKKNTIIAGVILLLIGVYGVINKYYLVDTRLMKYILNYQIILIAMGLYQLFSSRFSSGLTLTVIGLFLYLREFVPGFKTGSIYFLLILIGIIAILKGLGIIKKDTYKTFVFTKRYETNNEEVKREDIEEAEEIK